MFSLEKINNVNLQLNIIDNNNKIIKHEIVKIKKLLELK